MVLLSAPFNYLPLGKFGGLKQLFLDSKIFGNLQANQFYQRQEGEWAKMPENVLRNVWMFPPTALPHLCSSPCQRYLTGPIHSIPCRYCGSMSLWMDHQVNNYFFHLPTYLLFFSLGLSINVVYFVFQKTCSL